MQTVLVASGAGFIGSNLCKSFLDDGYKVTCIDNLKPKNKKNIENLLNNSPFTFVECDITKSLGEIGNEDNGIF